MEVPLVDASERTEVRAERRTCSFAGVAVDLASAIPIIISRPLAHAMADRGMREWAPPITRPCIGIEPRALGGHVVSNQVLAGLPVRMVAEPPALLACVARDDTDDGGPSVGRGAVAFALIGASTRWSGGSAMRRACFPPRCGTVHPPRRQGQPLPPSAPCRSGGVGGAAAGYGAACAPGPARGPGGLSARLWPHRAAAAPAWPGAAASFQRWSPSVAYNSRHRPDPGRPENTLGHGTRAVQNAHSVGIRAHAGRGDAPARGYKCSRPSARQSESQSCGHHSTSRTIATHEPVEIRTVVSRAL
jgi:hypothetical protein